MMIQSVMPLERYLDEIRNNTLSNNGAGVVVMPNGFIPERELESYLKELEKSSIELNLEELNELEEVDLGEATILGYWFNEIKRTKINELYGSINIMGDNSSINYLKGYSRIKKLKENSRVKVLDGDSVITYMYKSSTVENMRSNSQIYEIIQSFVENMYGNSIIERVSVESFIGSMRDNSKILCIGSSPIFDMYDSSSAPKNPVEDHR